VVTVMRWPAVNSTFAPGMRPTRIFGPHRFGQHRMGSAELRRRRSDAVERGAVLGVVAV